MKTLFSILTASAAGLFLVGAAKAADLPSKSAPAAAAPAAAAPVSLDNTLSFEWDPEFRISNTGINKGKVGNATVDNVGVVKYAHTWFGSLVTGVNYLFTNRVGNGGGSELSQGELAVGYKFPVGGGVTITPGATIGYAWGATKFGSTSTSYVPFTTISTTTGNSAEAYYAFTLAADWKINSQWTWNVVQLRYRDAFNSYYNTPKVQTGVTYALTPSDAVYGIAGYAWKNLYNHDIQLSNNYADKWNLAFGYKRSF